MDSSFISSVASSHKSISFILSSLYDQVLVGHNFDKCKGPLGFLGAKGPNGCVLPRGH